MGCQKSDCLIVVKKPVKAGGAKGTANSRTGGGSIDDTRGRDGNGTGRQRDKVPVGALSGGAGVNASGK